MWDRTIPGLSGQGYLVGTEYKAGDGLFNMENVNGATIVNQNAVCAACHITRSTQVCNGMGKRGPGEAQSQRMGGGTYSALSGPYDMGHSKLIQQVVPT